MNADPTPRDTDADWREIGATEPFWGVFTCPEYQRANLNETSLAAFYAAGRDDMLYTTATLREFSIGAFSPARALDFGCGVGRLTEAMCAHADQVTGYDISPGMLEEAKRRSAGKAHYVGALPDGPFDWINSWIVFQHIPPARGLELVAELMARLAAGGFISLQFTIYRDPIHDTEAPPDRPVGAVTMFDYDLSEVLRVLHAGGIERMLLDHRDQGGVHAVTIFGRREATSPAPASTSAG
jgi:SAM-dependent methyltransferase